MLTIIWLNATVTVPTSSWVLGASRSIPKFPFSTSLAFRARVSRGRVKLPMIAYSRSVRHPVTTISTTVMKISRYRRYWYRTL